MAGIISHVVSNDNFKLNFLPEAFLKPKIS